MNTTSQPALYRIADLTLDVGRRSVARNGQALHLGKLTYEMLVALVEAAPNVVTHEFLAEKVWSRRIATPETVAQRIKLLRLALDDDPGNPRYVEVLRGQGCRLIPPVERESGTVSPAVSEPGTEQSQAPRPPTEPAGLSEVAPAVTRPTQRPRQWLTAGALLIALVGVILWQAYRASRDTRTDPFDRYLISKLTEFEGAEEQAAISRDGRMVAFLRERDGRWDVWAGQIGPQIYKQLSDETMQELRNPAVRSLGFMPDGSHVMIWTRTKNPSQGDVIDAGWAVPTLGGSPQPYLRNIAELEWSADGGRIVFHSAEAGDPMFVADTERRENRRAIHVSPAGLHNHFPLWSRDAEFIYFVHGYAPDEMDVWRVPSAGGKPERLTFHNARVTFPTWLDERTLLYLATAEDASGPWVHALDVVRRASRRVDTGGREYGSLAASADGRRIVATEVRSTASLWRAPMPRDTSLVASAATRLDVPWPRSMSPRFGAGHVVFHAKGPGKDGIFRLAGAATTELWSGAEGRVAAGPAVSTDGTRIAFPVQRRGSTQLYLVNVDGSGLRRLAEELDVRGAPAWSPDGDWIAIGAMAGGKARLYKIPLAGGAPVPLGESYATDPAWSPSGNFLVYSTEDVGTNFSVEAVNADGTPRALPPLVLSRGSRRMKFLDEETIVVLKGDLSHKEIWSVNLRRGRERQLTALGPGPAIHDFDVSGDGREIVFDRIREDSDIVLMELPDTD